MYTPDIYMYKTPLPPGVNEMVTPCDGGYTVYIDSRLSHEKVLEAYKHAVEHINRDDFQKEDVQLIETEVRE